MIKRLHADPTNPEKSIDDAGMDNGMDAGSGSGSPHALGDSDEDKGSENTDISKWLAHSYDYYSCYYYYCELYFYYYYVDQVE